MTRETLEKKINELNESNGDVYGYFATWICDFQPNCGLGIVANEHGPYSEFVKVLDRIESSKACINGELPIVKIILYFRYYAIVFAFNPDSDDETCTQLSVPYFDKLDDAKGGNVFVITDEWTDWEKHYEFVGVYGDECEANKAALEMANSTYGHHFEVTKHKLNK